MRRAPPTRLDLVDVDMHYSFDRTVYSIYALA
jgi:hypothetical protein